MGLITNENINISDLIKTYTCMKKNAFPVHFLNGHSFCSPENVDNDFPYLTAVRGSGG